MRPPRQREAAKSDDLFRARLEQIMDMKHELVQLTGKIDWAGSTARSPRSTAPERRAGDGRAGQRRPGESWAQERRREAKAQAARRRIEARFGALIARFDADTTADVYFGRGNTILVERERIKRQTIQSRRLMHPEKPPNLFNRRARYSLLISRINLSDDGHSGTSPSWPWCRGQYRVLAVHACTGLRPGRQWSLLNLARNPRQGLFWGCYGALEDAYMGYALMRMSRRCRPS